MVAHRRRRRTNNKTTLGQRSTFQHSTGGAVRGDITQCPSGGKAVHTDVVRIAAVSVSVKPPVIHGTPLGNARHYNIHLGINPLTAKLFNLNYHPLGVVSR